MGGRFVASEQEEQILVMQWAAWNTPRFPALRFLFHIPNGGSRNIAEAANLKKMGVKPGVPDLFLPEPVGDWHGLWIEMKTETGRPTGAQREWIEHLRNCGYCAYVCHGSMEAINAIEAYLSTRSMEVQDADS